MGPFKCPECGIWWAGFEHRCPPSAPNSSTLDLYPVGFSACTCPPNRHTLVNGNYVGTCPIHDPSVTYTSAGLSTSEGRAAAGWPDGWWCY